jgi:Flp pilus assembly protein TadD
MAMAEPSPGTVRGQFDRRRFTHGALTSTFTRRGDTYVVRTDGPDGRLADFDVAYTFGWEPLQQYLVRLPGGRLQALSLAWDTRPAAEGGQRWFDLNAGASVHPGDALHWSGVFQNWNLMCADCHSTNVRKGYDQSTHSFTTTWSEISVGCEACHGPGSRHVEEARRTGRPGAGAMSVTLDERKSVTWTYDTARRVPVRSAARSSDKEIETCARCHSRREQLTDAWTPGEPFENGFRPSFLEPPLYHVDGQQRDEVYTYGSFLQSRMYAAGVTCSDCHNAHTGALRRPGNATCTSCHQDPYYERTDHHLHRPGSAAAQCVTCHMPAATYMTVDPRHDHGFRVPRPDRSVTLGVPDVCTGACHRDHDASWAARQIAQRRQHPATGFQTFAESFAALDASGAGASAGVVDVASDASRPAVVRATALARLAHAGQWASSLAPLIDEPSPMIRRALLGALAGADETTRTRLALRALSDPIRTVRIEAARALMNVADRSLHGPELSLFETAFGELVAEAQFNGDRPEGQSALGAAWMARGRLDLAVRAFDEAIRLDASFSPAYVNLSEVHRLNGSEQQAERVLRDGLEEAPADAALHHALGLSLVRQRRGADARAELREAVRLSPSTPRYRYVLAVALHDAGNTAEALRVLAGGGAADRADPDTLLAIALYSEEAGDLGQARVYAERLRQVRPDDSAVRRLVERLAAR